MSVDLYILYLIYVCYKSINLKKLCIDVYIHIILQNILLRRHHKSVCFRFTKVQYGINIILKFLKLPLKFK